MANLAVNVPREIEDLTYNPRQPGSTNLAYGAYENPKTFSATTSNGDFAGEVSSDYNGKVRIIDPISGDPLFEAAGPEATGAAFTVVNQIAKEKGRNASWAVQIDDGKGGWATAASDFVDPKEASPLGMVADIALPLIASFVLPGVGGFLAGPWMTAALSAGGSALSSLAQGRPMDETLKRAIISGASAGLGKFASGAIGNAAANAASSTSAEMGSMLASAAARGTITAAEAATAGATAAQMIAAGVPAAAAQAAASAAGNTNGELVVQGGANTAGNVTNAALQTVGGLSSGLGTDTLQGGFFDKKPTATAKGPEDSTVDELTVVGKNPASGTVFDDVLNAGGPLLSEVVVEAKLNPDQIQTVHKSLALGLTPEEIAIGLGIPLAAVGIVQANGAAIEAANLADPLIGGGEIITGASAPAFATLKEGMAWIAANPLLAARLGLTAASLLATFGGGGNVGANGLATGGGTPPALQQSALFKKALPAPSGIFANLAPRDVSKSVTDWNKYGEGGEQSFFANVPVRANGVTPDPNLVVTPSNPSTGGGTSTGTSTGTGTTATGQTPTNLAVQNMAKYGQTPGVLDLRNQPTSVDNPYAGYATTRTPPTGAVALPTNSNARFVVQDPMTAAEAEKQARMSASMVGVPASKDLAVKTSSAPTLNQETINQNLAVNGKAPGVLDLRNQPTDVNNPYAGYATTRTAPQGAVALPENSNARFVVQGPMATDGARTTGTPPQPAAPPSLAVNAPTSRPTDAYSPADLERIQATMGPDTVAAMRRINDQMAQAKVMSDNLKPLGEGLMSQWQLDSYGLKEAPAAAPKGVDPGSYYFMTQRMQGMTPAEIDAYNARVEAAPELLGTTKMAQINSPEWFSQNFGLNEKQAKAAAADVVAKSQPTQTATAPTYSNANLTVSKSDSPTAEQLAALDIIQRPGNGAKQASIAPTYSNKAMLDAVTDPAPRANPTPSLAVDVQPQSNYNLNVPEDVMKQLEAYNFQFKRGGTTSRAFAVKGAGDGRADKIDAKLSDGEYVIDAETVALLGNGSSKAGAAQLDKFRVNIRKHKGQKLASGKFSANAKSPEAYLAGGRR